VGPSLDKLLVDWVGPIEANRGLSPPLTSPPMMDFVRPGIVAIEFFGERLVTCSSLVLPLSDSTTYWRSKKSMPLTTLSNGGTDTVVGNPLSESGAKGVLLLWPSAQSAHSWIKGSDSWVPATWH